MALYTWSMRFLAFYVSLVFLIASSCFTKFFFLMAYIVKYSGLYLLEYYSSYVGIIILMHSFEITFKSNWYLSTSVSPVERNLRVHFFGESKNRFVISDHTDSSLPKKQKFRKRLIYHDNSMSSHTSWEKKKQQTDPHGEDKKKKQHKLGTNIWNVYILVWNTNIFRIEYTP